MDKKGSEPTRQHYHYATTGKLPAVNTGKPTVVEHKRSGGHARKSGHGRKR